MSRIIQFSFAMGLLCSGAHVQAQDSGRVDITSRTINGQVHLTIRAERVPVERFLNAVAEELELDLAGLARIDGSKTVDAILLDRPLRPAMRSILLSAGLRAQITSTALEVSSDLPAYATANDTFLRSYLAHEALLRNHPGHEAEVVFEQKLAQACDALGPDYAAKAIQGYGRIADRHPNSPEAPSALLRCAELLTQETRWNEASIRFQELVDLGPTALAFRSTALLGLVRCFNTLAEQANVPSVRNAHARKAIFALDALDTDHPSLENDVLYMRLTERSFALSMTRQPLKAMKSIDLAIKYSRSGASDPNLVRLRARAFEAAQLHDEACLAWMHFGKLSTGKNRIHGLRSAAQSALDGDQELTALFICGLAEDYGISSDLIEFQNEANLRLELGGENITALTTRQEISKASLLLEDNRASEAVIMLRRAFGNRSDVDLEQRLALVQLYARALEMDALEEQAINVLRVAANEFDDSDSRKVIYRAASSLFSRRGQTTAAINALRGEL